MKYVTTRLFPLLCIGTFAITAMACGAADALDGSSDTAVTDDDAGSTGDAVTNTDGTVGSSDVAEPTPDVEEPTPDVEEPTPDIEEPTPDIEVPTPDVEDALPAVEEPMPDVEEPSDDTELVEDVDEGPFCIPGTVSCDDGWVVVCTPEGDEWSNIVECGEGTQCFEGTCCTPACTGLSCGSDGCGGSCGECADGEMCDDGSCVCAPDCEGKNCGDDGCGDVCGECSGEDVCDEGVCVCIPACDGAMCGDDGCGGSCGECAADNECTEGVCYGPCTPGETRCNAGAVEVCNPDGESWSAVATCGADAPCFEGMCCTPVCDGVVCGGDGCGGSCGSCEDDELCFEGGCWPSCDEPGATGCDGYTVTMCSADYIEEPLVDCLELGQTCENGECVEPVVPPAECPEVCVGATVEAALCALDICYEDFLLSAEIVNPTGDDITGAWEAMEQYGDQGNDLTPQAPPSYLVLATGPLTDLTHKTDLPGGNPAAPSDPFSSDGFGMHDAVEFTLELTAPPGVTGFAIDSLFMSVEYEEWIGSTFNDKLYLIVNGEESTGGEAKVINYAACSNPDIYFDFENDDGKWCYIAINTAYSEPCSNWTTDLAGTGFSCPEGSSTGWLRTTHPVTPDETFTLTLHIHDTSDGIYDSAALFDNFQWLAGPVVHQTVPIAPADCVAECGDKVCGTDACGESCGECADGEGCTEEGLCESLSGCEGPNPAGCGTTECPEGQFCTPSGEDNCVPSSCECNPESGDWECTEDCNGGVCFDPTPGPDATGIQIEVTWNTPADNDQTDTGPEAGSDLDLHFKHPSATSDDGLGWFDTVFDCYWFNATPDWGSLDGLLDNPIMIKDDTDGAGPEIVVLEDPEDDTVYRVGVHYWNDHGFGASFATVKIWIDGELVKTIPEAVGASMVKGDLWEVATIAWPSGEVTQLETDSGGHVILSDYEAPF